MEKIFDNITVSLNEGQTVRFLGADRSKQGVTVYKFHLAWTKQNAHDDDEFSFQWSFPITEGLYKWNQTGMQNRYLPPDWLGYEPSLLSRGAPVCSHYNANGINRQTWAISECAKTVFLKSGVIEENGHLNNKFRIPLKQFTGRFETEVQLYIDDRQIPLYQAMADVALFWADGLGLKPMSAPESAYEPLYSFWYSYHQNITEAEVEAECKRAKELGFDICIVDDGWQTDDTNRGYAYCGDWEPTPSKFPNIKEHIKRVHDMGMKYMLWFSVPFLGEYVKNYERFKDKFLRFIPSIHYGVLDPRYKEVRDFLLSVYIKAVKEWGLDGLKLDFIDEWRFSEDNPPYNEKMDIADLSDAVDRFMTDVANTLKAINPDVLIEFRQNYVGPNMRKYGNMFRVQDCPFDYTKNRVGILDMRMCMKGSAVHSDMLMWNCDTTPEAAAVQIINIMFGVLQYSARLDSLTPEQAKMSKFWLEFLKTHKELLLKGELSAYDSQMLYTWAKSTLENCCAVGVFSPDKCVKPDATDIIYIANGSTGDRVIVDLEGSYSVKILNCMGEQTANYSATFNGVNAIDVSVGGLAVLTRE